MPGTGGPSFRDISFGYASAETERTQDPGLITEGHIDFQSSTDAALEGPRYLFLGYKGTGKSSIGERLLLKLNGSSSDFIRGVSLSDFPFTPFSKIIRGDAEPEVKYPSAWSWILLVYLLESFGLDEALGHPDYPRLKDAMDAFRMMGLSPASNPGALVRTSAKHNFTLSLPGKLAEYTWSGSEQKPASEIPNFVESLKELLTQCRSPNRHYLVIDGLDDILTSREVQYRSLSALIFEVDRLNLLLSRHGAPGKIIVLCRTDLFERIPGANKNKIRQDRALELDWYHDPREPEQSLLIQIAQLRATRSLGTQQNMLDMFFPETIDGIDIARYLLEITRHTPRDFLQLLAHLQKFYVDGKLNSNQIKSGLREYSIKYFLPEIQDEMSGYATPDEIQSVLAAFAKLRKRDFKLPELQVASAALSKPVSNERLAEIVVALFNCSALGNIQHRSGGTTYYTFKYRNRHSSFNEFEDIILHRGLWKALNLV